VILAVPEASAAADADSRIFVAAPAGWPEFAFRHVTSTGSTMDEARHWRAQGHRSGCVVADWQSAGRGRLPGREWQAGAGSSLLCTIWLPLAFFRGQPPSLLAGAALLTTLQPLLLEAAGLCIKWPNDLLHEERKLAGLLCEAAGDTLYCGIGLNLSQTDFPDTYRRQPTSLLLACGQAPERGRVVADLLVTLDNYLGGRLDWHTALNRYLAWRGQLVDFIPGIGEEAAVVSGTLLEVAADGAICITTADGVYAGYSGELHLHHS